MLLLAYHLWKAGYHGNHCPILIYICMNIRILLDHYHFNKTCLYYVSFHLFFEMVLVMRKNIEFAWNFLVDALLCVIFTALVAMETIVVEIWNFAKIFVITHSVDLCKKVKLSEKKIFCQNNSAAGACFWSNNLAV